VPAISDHTATIETMPVFWREAPIPGGAPAVPLYLHGVPTSSDDWLPFLERTGGLAPDLLGFGRSGKAGNLDYTIEGYADFVERYLDLVSVDRVSLVVHDWGVVGLAFAQRHPERVARLVVINAIPFLPGYRWHRTARLWRTPLLGELAMGATTRRLMRYSTREARPERESMPEAWLDSVIEHFDQGTQRAILRLYRSAPPDVLAAAGARLGTLQMPALVVWGEADPYIPARFGRDFAQALPDAELLELADAGHWPWIDRPDLIEHVGDFLGAGAAPSGTE
jgi:pimeloyl-ACP methyl ester carboxylesterase